MFKNYNTYQRYYGKASILQLAMLSFSVFVLSCLLVDALFTLPNQISLLIRIYDNALCVVFLLDFSVRFAKADKKIAFMRYGWLDLLSSIPTFGTGSVIAVTKVFRVLRMIRIYRTIKIYLKHIKEDRSDRVFVYISCVVLFVVMSTSIAILAVETVPESTITTAQDSLWWTITTLSTVGYGDTYPVTGEGRLIGGILMMCGILVIGTISAYISSWVHKKHSNKDQETI